MKKNLQVLATCIAVVALIVTPVSIAHAATLLSDTFSSTTIDTTKWNEFDSAANGTGGTAGNVQQTGTALSINGNSTWGTNGLQSAAVYDRSAGDITIETDVTPSICSSSPGPIGVGYGDPAFAIAPGTSYVVAYTSSRVRLFYFNNGVQQQAVATTFSCTNNVPFHVKLVVLQAGGANLYLNGSGTIAASVTGGTFSSKSAYLEGYSGNVLYNNFILTGTPSAANAPSAPTNLSLVPGNGQLSATWTAPVTDNGLPVTDYKVEYKAVSSSTWLTFNDGVSTATSAVITGLTNNTAYNVQISAINSSGLGGASGYASSTPVSQPVVLQDNFNTNTIDSAIWKKLDRTPNGQGSTTFNTTVSGGQVIVPGGGGDSDWNINGLASNAVFDRSTQDLVIQGDLTFPSCSNLNGGFVYGPVSLTLLAPGAIVLNKTPSASNTSLFAYPTRVNISGYTCGGNQPVNVRLVIKAAGGVDVYLNGSATPSASLTASQAPSSFTGYPVSLQSNTGTVVFDNVSVAGAVYVPTAPTALVVSGRPSALLVQWNPIPTATDYLVEYKKTADTAWSVFGHTVSATPGVTITGVENGTSYDIRVSTVSSNGTTSPSSTATGIPSAADANFYNHILVTGQSLSIGYGGAPALSTTQPYNNKTAQFYYSPLSPLIESSVETTGSGMANTISSMVSPAAYDSIVTHNGISGIDYNGLKKGTVSYTTALAQMTATAAAAVAANRPYRIPAIVTIHGEADEIDGTSIAQYEADLVQWQKDYQSDAQAVTGQKDAVPLFTDQMASWTGYNHATPLSAIAQYNAAKDNPSTIFLVAPKYMLDYVDNAHLTNYSYRRLGEYYGKVMKKVLVDGQSWKPLVPTNIVNNANIITADFNVPSGKLVFDTTRVLEQQNYGFEYSDSTNSATITKVELADDDTVKITLSNTPTGTNQRLRYAYTGTSGSNPGRTQSGAPRGNLRDTDATPVLYTDNLPANFGTDLADWAMTFDEPITNVSTGVAVNTLSGGGAPVVPAVTIPQPVQQLPADCQEGEKFSATTGAQCTSVITPSFIKTLKIGIIDSAVKVLQQYLNAHGFIVAKTGAGSAGKETTYFGPATKAAVIKFQKAKGLTADGIVGKITASYLK